MNTYPYLDDDLAYWTHRLEAAEADLRALTQETLTTTEQLKTQMAEVAMLTKAVKWRSRRLKSIRPTSTKKPVRRSTRIAARAASARIAQDAGLRRSARIAARKA